MVTMIMKIPLEAIWSGVTGFRLVDFLFLKKIIVVPHGYWSLKDFLKNDKICPKNCKKSVFFSDLKKITPLIRNVHRQMLLKDIGFWYFSRCWGRLRCVEKFKNLQVPLVGCSNVWLIFISRYVLWQSSANIQNHIPLATDLFTRSKRIRFEDEARSQIFPTKGLSGNLWMQRKSS